MDPELKGDGGYHVTYTSSEMPTYTSSQYSGDIHGYFPSEMDWQNGAVDASRSMYSIAPRPEIAPQLQYYSTYQPTSHPDLYPSQVLWTGATGNGTALAHGTPNRRDSRGGSSSNGRPKRRRTQSVIQRRAANVRERRRMFQLNEAFDALRKRLPAFNYEKRLSRIETLRLAMTYISFMQDVTTGADPKHVKLLTYHSDDSLQQFEVKSNGYESSTIHDKLEMVRQEEHITESPSLINGSHHTLVQSSAIQPITPEPSDNMSIQVVPEHENMIQSSAVHVEMLPSVPPTITLPVTNHVILTEEEVPIKEEECDDEEEDEEEEEEDDESDETVEATQHLENHCPSN